VGASGGHLAAAARERGWRAVATDIAPQACVAAHSAHGVPAVQADGLALPVASSCLEAVTAVNVVDQIGDPGRLLREARRILVPGGTLVVRVPNAAFHVPWIRVLGSLGPFVRGRGWDRYPVVHFFALARRGLVTLVEGAGFTVLEVRGSVPAWSTSRAAVAVLAAVTWAAATATRGRWLLTPSIELYAVKPPGGRRR
jgi:SAM-dependent methyltransferase